MLDSKEIWKDLKGFEGIYQVSNLSTVYGACNGYHLLKGHKVAYG